MNTTTLTPAYGRDYKSKKAALADFHAGKDFIINDFFSPWDGKPAGKNDLKGYLITFRFNNLRTVATHQN